MKAPPNPARRRLIGAGAACAGSLLAPKASAQDEYGDAALRGAGSTFVQPLMDAWVRQYRADPFQLMGTSRGLEGGLGDRLSNDGLDYEPVGSLGGIQRISAGVVDLAASEMPLGADFLRRHGLVQFPWVVGGVALVATLPPDAGADPLRLDASTLAGIFLGKLSNWSDPAIAALNPEAKLPDTSIRVLHRSDGSGTTFTFSNYLSRTHGEWKERLGSDLLLKWPVGRGLTGSAIVPALKSTPQSIGYVNAVQARQAGLPLVALRNQAGRYVLPDRAGIDAAVQSMQSGGEGPDLLPIDAPGEATYPLVATVFGLIRYPIRSTRERRIADFVAWTMARGAVLTERLGYRSVPAHVAKAMTERLTRTS